MYNLRKNCRFFVCGKLTNSICSWEKGIGASSYHTKIGVYGHKPNKESENEIPPEVFHRRHKQCNVYQLVNAYRRHGHRLANIDPVDFKGTKRKVPELNVERYGLKPDEPLDTSGMLHSKASSAISLDNLVSRLQDIYCGPISYEFLHLENERESEWFAERVESSDDSLDGAARVQMARDLLQSMAWDNFLATKFPSVKRYGAEGAETINTFFRTVIGLSAQDGLKHIVLGMPHRGKLNLLTGLLQCPPVKVFHKYSGKSEFPPSAKAMADIAQHFSVSADFTVDGKTVHLSMLNNPSHLEAVNPVSMGKARSKQMQLKEGDYSVEGNSRRGDHVLNIQVHGDAAFCGQGINQETLMLSQAPHFDIGGTIHMVVNNQVGFTTPADRGRSSTYTTDLAKMIGAPIIHVNAEYPEQMVRATRIAFEYQRAFRKDVFVDYNCYRRWGHNEVDDPTFTNPALYKLVRTKKPFPERYAEQLKSEGLLTDEEIKRILKEYTEHLQEELDRVPTYQPEMSYFKEQWTKMQQAPSAIETWDTGVDVAILRDIGEQSVQVPEEFTIHPHLEKTYVKNRLKKIAVGKGLDWATAEALAFGSLLLEGHNVRLSGEDVGRGTFSHRHAMLVDNATNEICIPLNHLAKQQKGFLEVANSILSEEAVLGYEYGMAIDSPDNLVVWEAQFGDFFNGAQIIIDTYVATGETKWMTSNGLVMLLPHGYDGAASDHSSCRLERWLQLTDSREAAADGEDVNMQVVFPTTPAQYFHLLRRQMVRNYRKPLVVAAPKILLRLSEATSDLAELAPGKHFKPVLGDSTADPKKVKRLIFVSGKHYYALHQERLRGSVEDAAIIRLESLCPFPLHHLNAEVAKYKNARTFIWSQEEPRNMGAWSFVRPRFENLAAIKLRYSGRAEGATTAVGVSSWHQAELKHIVQEPLYTIK